MAKHLLTRALLAYLGECIVLNTPQHASPNGVLYEHLQTEPLKALVQHVWTINNLNWTQQQRCAKLIGHPAIAFPGSKLPNDLQFILQDDDVRHCCAFFPLSYAP